MIGLAEDLPEKEGKYELHRLLGALLSAKLDVNTKLDIIGSKKGYNAAQISDLLDMEVEKVQKIIENE